ncbi:coiled-coil domain-containing protein [Subtercola endophyticus]|uniref:hypothetical protein n=1 Tax=Subtercola endophyticus TaxID=2895559 RepID=UPI001E64F06E|nr:hypothetical protein [Subtercola endophyticus]UFS60499.1 hypothetical protein LQ955_07100 [Subtercola endophyticus]
MTDDSTAESGTTPENVDETALTVEDQPTVAEPNSTTEIATAATPGSSSSVVRPVAATGYVLTRRDRTAMKMVDWAVGFGSAEFQSRYKPVSDELFTHHFIDPTARPAFVPPAIASVEQLDQTSDPLEIIRAHLGVVIDDRQARDKARLDAQTHYEEVSRTLADVEARAERLDTELAETTERLRVADAEIVTLNERLEAEVSGLHTDYSAQIDALRAQLETDTAEQRLAHEEEITRLHGEHAAALALLASSHDTTVGGLTTGHETALAELDAQHTAELADADAQHDEAIAALQAEHDERHGAAALQLAAAVAAAELTTRHLTEARLEASSLTAQRDRAIAEASEWRSRLEQVVAGLASTTDVGEWTVDNAPDARLVDFVAQTQLELTTQLELAQATLDEIEDVATAQLVDENETSDYAIGANDAAVLVLNSLYGEGEAEEVDGFEGSGVDGVDGTPADADIDADGAAAADAQPDAAELDAATADVEELVANGSETDAAESEGDELVADGAQSDSVTDEADGDDATEIDNADAEFENALGGEVDVDFENHFNANAQQNRAS